MKMDNSNIEQLETSDINITVNNNVTTISQPVETIAIDSNGEVDPISIEYNKYRDKINKIYQANTDGSILVSEFEINGNTCEHSVIVRKLNGDKNILLSNTFLYDDGFRKNFLTAVLKDFSSTNEIVDYDLVNKENSMVDFSVRTKENNIFNIKNIDVETGENLNNFIANENDSNNLNSNQKGIGNYLAIGLTILLISIILIGTIYFTIKAAK